MQPHASSCKEKQARVSPWAHIAAELEAEAREHSSQRDKLGDAFQEVQEEAYETWCAWETRLERSITL
jgi:hypothetical protein